MEQEKHDCVQCKKQTGIEFECVRCCIRWLSKMTKEEIKVNAPMIERIAGKEQLEKVRAAWGLRKP